MSKFSKLIASAAVIAAVASCSDAARIDGQVEQAASSEVIVKLLNINKYEVLDTVSVDASGKFSYKLEVEEGQPEFVYLFHGDKKIASLLLEADDKVSVKADTLGNFTVEGSEESVKLAQVEKDYAAVIARIAALAAKLETASEKESEQINRDIVNEYITYYRSRVRYVMENSKSLTSVPVLYQVVGDGLPVFSQMTDAIHFANICDSLDTVYPDSKYVKALKKDAQSRRNTMEINARIGAAEEIGFPDVDLPDQNGQKCRLSSLDSKVIMVQFWSSADAAQKMFNLDNLKPLYDDYHKKGLEIYQISLDTDKGSWAKVVKEQNLPWISVCDTRAGNSPYVMFYNVTTLPATYIIADGELVDGSVVDDKQMRELLSQLLK